MRRVLAAILLMCAGAAAQAVPLRKAVALTTATIYVSPERHSTPVGSIQPGEDVGIQGTSRDFLQVFTGVSGWILNQGLVRLDAPNAADVMFGAAVGLQNTAESGGGENQAALGAARLYLDVYRDFPKSPRAAEALYRGAEINWQLKINELPRERPTSSMMFPNTHDLQQVVSKFKNTPWAARADFHLLVKNFDCGDWTENPPCLDQEIHTYQNYIKKYPDGPDTAEAAYDVVYREGIAWTIYNGPGKNHDARKASRYAAAVQTDAAAMGTRYAGTDWAAQAAYLAFNVAHDTALTVPGVTPIGGP